MFSKGLVKRGWELVRVATLACVTVNSPPRPRKYISLPGSKIKNKNFLWTSWVKLPANYIDRFKRSLTLLMVVVNFSLCRHNFDKNFLRKYLTKISWQRRCWRCRTFSSTVSSTLINFELVRIWMRVDQSLCAFDQSWELMRRLLFKWEFVNQLTSAVNKV